MSSARWTAYDDGVDRVIDLAEVNGRVFVNNASMGVVRRSRSVVGVPRRQDADRGRDAARDLLGPDATPMDLRFTLPSGERGPTAALLLVSNNQYELHQHPRRWDPRRGSTRGVLGDRVACRCGGGRHAAEGLAAHDRAGQLRRFGGWQEWTATEFEVRSGDAGRDRRRRGGAHAGAAAAVHDPPRGAHGPDATPAHSVSHRPRWRSESRRPRPSPRCGGQRWVDLRRPRDDPDPGGPDRGTARELARQAAAARWQAARPRVVAVLRRLGTGTGCLPLGRHAVHAGVRRAAAKAVELRQPLEALVHHRRGPRRGRGPPRPPRCAHRGRRHRCCFPRREPADEAVWSAPPPRTGAPGRPRAAMGHRCRPPPRSPPVTPRPP